MVFLWHFQQQQLWQKPYLNRWGPLYGSLDTTDQILINIVHHEIPLNNFLQCPSWSLFPPFYRAKPCNLLFLLVLPQLMSHQYLLKQFFCHWKLTLFNNQYKLSFIPNKQKHIEVKVTSQANVCQTMHISIIKKAKVYVTVTW